MQRWTDDADDGVWLDGRARRQRWVAYLVILALALPSTAVLWSLAS